MSERDSKRIIRQWNRDIEAEIRREKARDRVRDRDDGAWKAVSWAGLWLFWLAVLVVLVSHLKGLR